MHGETVKSTTFHSEDTKEHAWTMQWSTVLYIYMCRD